MSAWTYVPILLPWGVLPIPGVPTAERVPWAAMGFSVLWGAVVGLAITRDDPGLAAFSAAGMALTLVLTAVHRQQSQLRDHAETDSLTGLINHRGFQQALRGELRRAA